jgi:hypothetical protein
MVIHAKRSRRQFLTRTCQALAGAAMAGVLDLSPFARPASADFPVCGCTETINCNACRKENSCKTDKGGFSSGGKCDAGTFSPSTDTFAKIVNPPRPKGASSCYARACNGGFCACWSE